MGKRFRNPPLFFTIGQVIHNPLLSLGSYLPAIQERMRKAGFPDFQRANQVRFTLQAPPGTEGAEAQPIAHQTELYRFSDLDGNKSFIMEANSLIFQATTYDSFEDFFSQLELGLGILNEAVGGLSFYERLGLRYIDAVTPKEGEDLNLYVVNELLGLPERMPKHAFAHSFSESALLADGIGQVIARTIIQNGKLALPPDLQLNGLKLHPRFAQISGIHAVIDTDGFSIERHPFNMENIQARMTALHDLIGNCFAASVTDYARTTWDA